MKYLWIIMLGLAYGAWTVSAIKDCIHYHRSKFDVDLKDSTCGWFAFTIIVLFIWSFILWL